MLPMSVRDILSFAALGHLSRWGIIDRTAEREAVETIPWRGGELVTERWHRVSDDGRSDGYAWLAPSLRYVPVKIRMSTQRATFEATLDAIRVDEPLATQ